MYADYIFSDTSFLERWEFQGSHPNMSIKSQPIPQPLIAPIPQSCIVFGQRAPICFETMLMGIAEHLKLPGFGKDWFGPGMVLSQPDDLNQRAVANVAFGEKPDCSQQVPDADAHEIELLARARRHLPSEVFDATRWKRIVGEKNWPKVVYVLNRGGRFEDAGKAFKGELHARHYGKLLNLYQTAATTRLTTMLAPTGCHPPPRPIRLFPNRALI